MSEPLEHEFPDSTRVDHAWYYPDTREIVVRFPDGHRHRYLDVDHSTWMAFTRAGSAGRFLADELDRHPNGAA